MNFKSLQRFSFFLAVLIYLNIWFGPLVRATHSGLACPDWPLCYGKFVPEYTFQIAMEVGHRYYSGIIGLLFAFLLFQIFRNSESRRELGALGGVALFVLGLQIALGALTVTKLLDATTVNLHLLNAILFFLIVSTLSWRAGRIYQIGSGGINLSKIPQYWLLTLTLLLTVFQLYMGGRVSSHYAGLACPDFPTCYGSWFEYGDDFSRYQMEHRYSGYIVALFIIITSFVSIMKKYPPKSKLFLKASTYLIGIQIFLGAMNVLNHLPKFITIAHTGVAVLIIFTLYFALIEAISPEGTPSLE
jgi:cytochrome c oxidase assembly protein subunit 15